MNTKKIATRHVYMYVMLGFLGLGMYSCQSEFNQETIAPPVEQAKVTDTIRPKQETTSIITLGEQLQNPYSLVNMQSALDTIIKEVKKIQTKEAWAFHANAKATKIETTDLYIRFLPKDSSDLEMLMADTTLAIYDYPLDYKIENQGEHYHDEDLAEDQITWQYTVVKPNYKFPNIKYEILAKLFIPQHSEGYQENEKRTQANQMYSKTYMLDKLETVALYLTDNLPEDEKAKIDKQAQLDQSEQDNSNILRARRCIWFICWDEPDPWSPSGRIIIQDTELGWQGIEGVTIKARRWFVTKTTTTNRDGFYRTGSFKRHVVYSLHWSTHQFNIREQGWWFFSQEAIMRGSERRGSWNLRLTAHSKDWFHGTIFQAAYHYYYQNINGLRRPSRRSFWTPQMQIRAHNFRDPDNLGLYKSEQILQIFDQVKIYGPERASSSIYATTIHELAHASHWQLRKDKWGASQTASKVKESWARGVEWELTRMKYPPSLYKGRERGVGTNYTLVVADLIDGGLLSDTTNNGFTNPQDRVSGYTIRQIEDVLSYTSTWNNWRDNIRNRYTNPTERNLNILFTAYE